jgi:glycosyltransferase involved in cell wall biosynthesis
MVWHFMLLNFLAQPKSREDGYNVFGYFSKVVGQGEVARSYVDNLINSRTQFALVDFYDNNHKPISLQEENKYKKYYKRKLKYDTNLFFVDLVLLQQIRNKIPVIFKNRRNVVIFWWEFETGFEDRIPILNEFDEVYVFSDFIKNILEPLENRKFQVTKIKYPFQKNWEIESSPDEIRQHYRLTNKFCFFFNFDYRSSYNRKNPEATLRALYEEFSNDNEVMFVVKTSNTEGFESKENCFDALILDYGLADRVVVIKDSLSRNGFMSLLNAMDCYISLHRGEGLGLGILEAFALDKPVIATHYGGNVEYMDNALAYPVPYTMVPADDDYVPYAKVKSWAEPDITEARKHMRTVYNSWKGISLNNPEYI